MTANRGGRRPDPAVDAAVRDAVIELLLEQGFEMTFDEVAARAGVGRTSVFRRFPTKRDMILDAVRSRTVDQIQVPDTGSLRGDLIAGVTEIMRVFSEPRLREFVRRFLSESCRDPAFTDVFRANLDRRLELISAMLGRSVERGELLDPNAPALIADQITGIIILRMATDAPLPQADEISRFVDALLNGLAARG